MGTAGEVVLPITFEAIGGRQHCPMVHGRVGDASALFILDTGCTDHVLTRRFADAAALRVQPSEPGMDNTGAEVPSWDIGGVAIEIGGREIELSAVVAIDGPPPFAGWGIGGLLSPQRLWPSGLTILDLINDRLSWVETPKASVDECVSERFPEIGMVRGERLASGLLGVQVAIPPHDPVLGFFDTGASSGEADRVAVPSFDGTVEASGGSAGGRPIEGVRVQNPTLQFEGWRLQPSELWCRESIPAPEDAPYAERPHVLIGMDLLAGTALVMAPHSERVVWAIPLAALHRLTPPE